MDRKEKFTPGPWRVTEPNGAGNGMRIESAGDWPRLPEAWLGFRCTGEEQQANAALISAAPDLCEALEDLLGWQSLAPADVLEKAKLALAKSRGEHQ
jgi:hypothetical protein